MKTFKIDPTTGDIMFDSKNRIVMVEGDEELIQKIERTLSQNLGEWFLDPTTGFARFELLGQNYHEDRATQLLYDAILQIEEIETIEDLDFEFDRANRTLAIKASFIKANGDRLEADLNVNGVGI